MKKVVPIALSNSPFIICSAIEAASDIITYAKDSLELKLNQNVYLTLTDHIGFALNRHREGMDFNNVLYDEIRLFYPVEYSIGRYALELIEERTGYRLAEDEAASIALHIINGELDSGSESDKHFDLISVPDYPLHKL